MRRRAPKGGCWIGPKFYRGGQFLPSSPKANTLEPTLQAMADAMIHQAEADLPPDVGYSMAMIRVLRRRSEPSAKDLRTLDRRRRAAVALLADHPNALVRRHFGAMLASYPNT